MQCLHNKLLTNQNYHGLKSTSDLHLWYARSSPSTRQSTLPAVHQSGRNERPADDNFGPYRVALPLSMLRYLSELINTAARFALVLQTHSSARL